MIKTVQLSSPLNKIKEIIIIQTIHYYRKTSINISKLQWNNFFKTGRFDKNLNIKTLKSDLSERYKQSAQYQVTGILNSFLSNLKNDFKSMVLNSSLSNETKKQLYKINKNNLWFYNFEEFYNNHVIEENDLINRKFTKEEIKLSNKIFKKLLKNNNKPTFNTINMNLDFKVAEICENVNNPLNTMNEDENELQDNIKEGRYLHDNDNKGSHLEIDKKNKKKTATSFDYWINLSTYESGHKILIPLESSNYFDNIKGTMKKFCQINLNHNNQLSFNLIKEEINFNKMEKEEQILKYLPKTEEIGLDFGLVHLFSDNCGNHFGNDFYSILKDYDEK